MGRRTLRLLADLLAYVVSPLALPVVALTVGAVALGAGAREAWLIAAGSLLAHGIVPLVFLVWLVGRGEARSIEVRDRERRTAPYLFGAACVTLFALVLAVWLPPQRQALAWIECAQAVNTLVLMAINLRWKISLHLTTLAVTISTLATMALALDLPRPDVLPPGLFAFLALLVPALAWARVYAGAHTVAQTVGGTLFGLVVPALEIVLLHRWGAF